MGEGTPTTISSPDSHMQPPRLHYPVPHHHLDLQLSYLKLTGSSYNTGKSKDTKWLSGAVLLFPLHKDFIYISF